MIGYPVNLAARVEGATKTLNNDFLVSQTAYAQLPQPRPRTARKNVLLKGVTDPIAVRLFGSPYNNPKSGNGQPEERNA